MKINEVLEGFEDNTSWGKKGRRSYWVFLVFIFFKIKTIHVASISSK